MGYFRFWRRMKIAPGIHVNLSKSGPSLSAGPRGAKVTVGRRGVRRTVGVPGTGLHYTTQDRWGSSGNGGGKRSRSRARGSGGGAASPPPPSANTRLDLGFFKRLVTPASEEAFVDGCRALVRGRPGEALPKLEAAAASHPDGAFMAGVLHLKAGRNAEAAAHLEPLVRQDRKLGTLLGKYGIDASAAIPIFEQVTAVIGPRARGVRLALAQAHQGLEQWDRVVDDLERLHRSQPEDVVVRLALADLLVDWRAGDPGGMKRVVRLAKDVRNESPLHGALLLCKARALRSLGMATAARDTLTKTLRAKKDRPAELLTALRYERALAYADLGHEGRARKDLERVFAEDPDHADVAGRLEAA